jgi:hypothetical protein
MGTETLIPADRGDFNHKEEEGEMERWSIGVLGLMWFQVSGKALTPHTWSFTLEPLA